MRVLGFITWLVGITAATIVLTFLSHNYGIHAWTCGMAAYLSMLLVCIGARLWGGSD